MKSEIKIQRLLNLKEVVQILGLSKSTIYKEINNQSLKRKYVGKRQLRFSVDDINEYIKNCSK